MGYVSLVHGEWCISAYAYNQLLELWNELLRHDIKPDDYTCVPVLSSCADLASAELGQQVHSYVVTNQVKRTIFLDTALINMYAKCNMPQAACGVWEELKQRYYYLDHVCYSSILTACAEMGSLEFGQQVHSHIVASNISRANVVVESALINMYVKCGQPHKAIEVWRENSVLKPNSITYHSLLLAAAQLASLEIGKEIHSATIKDNLQNDTSIQQALINMYTKVGNIEGAFSVSM